MKSLVIKDLYNLSRNAKSMALVLVFLAVCQIPSIGAEGYLASCTIICTMLIITSFSIDEHYSWNRYALIMPISRNDLVAAKYLILAVVGAMGVMVGLVLGLTGTAVMGGSPLETLPLLLLTALMSFSGALVIGSTAIPMVFKFGAEKGKLMMILAALIPSGLVLGIMKLLQLLNPELPEEGLLIAAPVLAVLWSYASYRLSCRIFENQEL